MLPDPPPESQTSPSTPNATLAERGANEPDRRESASATLSIPGFLHPSSVLFEVISHIRQYIVPAILGVIGAAQGSFWWSGIALVVFASALAHTLIRYFTLRYGIQGDDFVVTEGLLFRRVRSVPIRRIQNMDLVQNVLHRLFGVAEVNIETASGTKPEATLRVLTKHQIDDLRQAIFAGEGSRAPAALNHASVQTDLTAGMTDVTTSIPVSVPTTQGQLAETIYRISVKQLVLAGLASNRGLILVGIAVGFFFQGDFEKRLDLDMIGEQLPQQSNPWQIALMVLLGFLGLMLLLRLLGIAWYVLRFYGYRLKRQGEDLRISCGLLTKVSATVPRKRIQFISVHRPLLMRWLGLASIRIETAGGAGSENENAAATVSRRWFLPVVSETEVNRILPELRPELLWDASQISWRGVSPLTARRLVRVVLLVGILFGCIGVAATRPWGWLAGPVAFSLLLPIAIKKSRSRKYARTAWGIAYQSGILTRKLSFCFYDRIQGLQLSQTPFDRRWQMATLSVDTAAAGPADHSIAVAYLEQDFAVEQFNDLQIATAHHRPSWA